MLRTEFSLSLDEHGIKSQKGYFLTIKENCGGDSGICSPNPSLFLLGHVDGLIFLASLQWIKLYGWLLLKEYGQKCYLQLLFLHHKNHP